MGSYQGFGEGKGTPLQYSCLEELMDGGAWWATVQGVTKSWTLLIDFTSSGHFRSFLAVSFLYRFGGKGFSFLVLQDFTFW